MTEAQANEYLRNRLWQKAKDIYDTIVEASVSDAPSGAGSTSCRRHSREQVIACLYGRTECCLELEQYDQVAQDCVRLLQLLSAGECTPGTPSPPPPPTPPPATSTDSPSPTPSSSSSTGSSSSISTKATSGSSGGGNQKNSPTATTNGGSAGSVGTSSTTTAVAAVSTGSTESKIRKRLIHSLFKQQKFAEAEVILQEWTANHSHNQDIDRQLNRLMGLLRLASGAGDEAGDAAATAAAVAGAAVTSDTECSPASSTESFVASLLNDEYRHIETKLENLILNNLPADRYTKQLCRIENQLKFNNAGSPPDCGPEQQGKKQQPAAPTSASSSASSASSTSSSSSSSSSSHHQRAAVPMADTEKRKDSSGTGSGEESGKIVAKATPSSSAAPSTSSTNNNSSSSNAGSSDSKTSDSNRNLLNEANSDSEKKATTVAAATVVASGNSGTTTSSSAAPAERDRKPGIGAATAAAAGAKSGAIKSTAYGKEQQVKGGGEKLAARGGGASGKAMAAAAAAVDKLNSITCVYCTLSFADRSELRAHCQTESHQNIIMSDEGRDWKWRPPPRGFVAEAYSLCENFRDNQNCHYGNQCVEAHGVDELNEWKERFEYRKKKLQRARDKELYGKSYTEQLLERWVQAPSPDKVMREKVEGVEDSCSHDLVTTISSKVSKREWSFVLKTKRPLRAVALLQDAHRNHFVLKQICPGGASGKKSGTGSGGGSGAGKGPASAAEVELTSEQEWIAPVVTGGATPAAAAPEGAVSAVILEHRVKVGFSTEIYGTFRQTVVFDVGKEPVLVKHICVDVVPVTEVDKIQEIKKDIVMSTAERWDETNSEVAEFTTAPIAHMQTAAYTADAEREKELLVRYPLPKASTFVLTQSTITEKRLTRNNYRNRIHELLYVEEIARYDQIARYNLTTRLSIVTNYLLTPSGMATSTAKYSHSGELFALMKLGKDVSEDTSAGRLILNNCQAVYIAAKEQPPPGEKRRVYEAVIEDKGKNMIYMKVSAKAVSGLGLKPETEFLADIQFQPNRLTYCEWHQAIDKIADFRLIFPEILAEPSIPWTPQRQWDAALDPKLNSKQKEAVVAITTPVSVPLPPILLIGPFGTGKTYTLAQAIKQLLLQDSTKILICTHSNSAADLYIKDYLHPWVEEGMAEARPLRVYYHKRWVATVNSIVQKYCLIDLNINMRNFRRPSVKDILKHRVVVVTLNISMELASLDLPKGHFTHIFLDEAAQAMECEAIMPLALAGERTRIVLAGDHMQMSPELFSHFAKERKLHVSLLERLYDHYPNDFPCKILLCENYRAHEAIIKFTSELFYEQKLIASGKQPRHEKFYPLTFFTTRGEDVQDKNSTAFYNNSEVYEVVERVCELRKKWPSAWGKINDQSIGIMTPYADQVFRIRSELRKRRMGGISVERVANVQGKQFRAIFLSTVRTRRTCHSNDGGAGGASGGTGGRGGSTGEEVDYGFLSNSKLLNTAITRAQSLVAVVGDPVALCSIGRCRKVWERFIEICYQNKSLFGITWSLLRSQLDGVELKKTYVLNPLAPEFIPRALQGEAYLRDQAASLGNVVVGPGGGPGAGAGGGPVAPYHYAVHQLGAGSGGSAHHHGTHPQSAGGSHQQQPQQPQQQQPQIGAHQHGPQHTQHPHQPAGNQPFHQHGAGGGGFPGLGGTGGVPNAATAAAAAAGLMRNPLALTPFVGPASGAGGPGAGGVLQPHMQSQQPQPPVPQAPPSQSQQQQQPFPYQSTLYYYQQQQQQQQQSAQQQTLRGGAIGAPGSSLVPSHPSTHAGGPPLPPNLVVPPASGPSSAGGLWGAAGSAAAAAAAAAAAVAGGGHFPMVASPGGRNTPPGWRLAAQKNAPPSIRPQLSQPTAVSHLAMAGLPPGRPPPMLAAPPMRSPTIGAGSQQPQPGVLPPLSYFQQQQQQQANKGVLMPGGGQGSGGQTVASTGGGGGGFGLYHQHLGGPLNGQQQQQQQQHHAMASRPLLSGPLSPSGFPQQPGANFGPHAPQPANDLSYLSGLQGELMAMAASNRMPPLAGTNAAGQKLNPSLHRAASGVGGGGGGELSFVGLDKSSDFQFLQNVHFPELRTSQQQQQQQQQQQGGHLQALQQQLQLQQQQQQQQQQHPPQMVGPVSVPAAGPGALGHHHHGHPTDFSHLLPPNMSFIDMALQTKEYQYYWFMKLMETKGLEAAHKFTDILRQVPTAMAAANQQAIKPLPPGQQSGLNLATLKGGPGGGGGGTGLPGAGPGGPGLSSTQTADLFLENLLNPIKDPLLVGAGVASVSNPSLHSSVLANGTGGGGGNGGGGAPKSILDTVDLFGGLASGEIPSLIGPSIASQSSQSVPLYRRQAGQNYQPSTSGGSGSAPSADSSTPDLLDSVHLHQQQHQQQQHYGVNMQQQQPSLVEQQQQKFFYPSSDHGHGVMGNGNGLSFGGNPLMEQQQQQQNGFPTGAGFTSIHNIAANLLQQRHQMQQGLDGGRDFMQHLSHHQQQQQQVGGSGQTHMHDDLLQQQQQQQQQRQQPGAGGGGHSILPVVSSAAHATYASVLSQGQHGVSQLVNNHHPHGNGNHHVGQHLQQQQQQHFGAQHSGIDGLKQQHGKLELSDDTTGSGQSGTGAAVVGNGNNNNNVGGGGGNSNDPFAALRNLGGKSNGLYNYFA